MDSMTNNYEVSIHNTFEAESLEAAVQMFREWLVMEGGAENGSIRVSYDDGTATYVDADGASWTG